MEEGKEINRAVVESLEHGQWAGLPGIHPTTCRISVGLESALEGRGAERESAENLYGKGVCDGCLFKKSTAVICLQGRTREDQKVPSVPSKPWFLHPMGTEAFSPSAPGTRCQRRTGGICPHTHLF